MKCITTERTVGFSILLEPETIADAAFLVRLKINERRASPDIYVLVNNDGSVHGTIWLQTFKAKTSYL